MEKKYNVIYADPPWSYKVWSKKGAGRSAESHYPTMSIEAIKALPVSRLAAGDCALFLWITFPMLREGWGVMDAWGFTFKTVAFVWVKQCRKSDSGDLSAGDPRAPEAGGQGCQAGHPLPHRGAQQKAG